MVEFDLLNPTDLIELNVFLEGSNLTQPDVRARIKGLKYIAVYDDTIVEVPSGRGVSWWSYVVGLMVLFFGTGFVITYREHKMAGKIRRDMRSRGEFLSQFVSREDLEKFIEDKGSFLTSRERAHVLSSWHPAEPNLQNNQERVYEALSSELNPSGSDTVYYLCLGVVILGTAAIAVDIYGGTIVKITREFWKHDILTARSG